MMSSSNSESVVEPPAIEGVSDVTTLLEALPWIKRFHERTVVIKYGGAAMEDPSLRENFARDIALLKYVGINVVVVHGGGKDITAYMNRLDIPVEFKGGLRVSSAETVEIAKMVLIGKVNNELVVRIGRHGQAAIGLSGDDGRLFKVETTTAPNGEDVGFVGKVTKVDTSLIDHVNDDFVPVIATVASDADGHSHNINADDAASAVARALRAARIIFLTDVAGWLEDPENPDSLITEASTDQVLAALPAISGGMRPKLQACVDCVQGGVETASIVDGRKPHSVLLELFTDRGCGTIIKAPK